jgi:hypothetical protein
MENIFLVAVVISIIYLILKIFEMKYIIKESKPLKLLIRDSIVVYVSILFGYFILSQVEPVVNNIVPSQPAAFTDNPPF